MNHSRTDIIVGLFVLIGAICLGYLAIKLGKLEVVRCIPAMSSTPIFPRSPASRSATR